MKFLRWGKDGGPESGVFGFWIVEIKPLFSIVLLRFDADQREAYHSHAFHAVTWWLSGEVCERLRDGSVRLWRPSLIPKITTRSCCHKVIPYKRTWAISFRGPWAQRWYEYRRDRQEVTTFEHGRRVVGVKKV
jgi:hypothetical protein